MPLLLLPPATPLSALLSEVYIGKVKESLDHVDPDLIIEEVVPVFGPFVKFAVEEKEVGFKL